MRTAYQDRVRDLLDLNAPIPSQSLGKGPLLPNAPVHRAPRHPANCLCTDCFNAAQRYTDYQHQKRMEGM